MLKRAHLKSTLPEFIEVTRGSSSFRIRVRFDPRARRYLLRLPADYSGPVLTIPKNGSLARGRQFASQHLDWLVEHLKQRPERIALKPGDLVPFRGQDHRILALGKLRGLVDIRSTNPPELIVPGAEDHIPRKVKAWLKSQAKNDLTRAARYHADRIGKTITAISVRDTKSRWGSCSSTGKLSFSWRLILAPSEILDYVAAHEVAHLVELNHSPQFWALCEHLAPHTRHARAWLKKNGAMLHGYG